VSEREKYGQKKVNEREKFGRKKENEIEMAEKE
jgi:hypothetical protein